MTFSTSRQSSVFKLSYIQQYTLCYHTRASAFQHSSSGDPVKLLVSRVARHALASVDRSVENRFIIRLRS